MKLENYKVRVENIAEADHVQQLFENIGYKKGELLNAGFPKLVVAVCDRDGKYSSGAQFYYSWHKCKELTIDQLRDLVANQKPIGKIPYLVKTIDKWEEQELTSDTPESATCLKIPDGAEYYAEDSILGRKVCEFFRIDPLLNHTYTDGNWEPRRFDKSRQHVLWQRKSETMPMHCADVSDGVLISGKEAFLLHMDGKEMQWRDGELDGDWVDWHETTSWSSFELTKMKFQFRIKPKTLTIGDKEYTKQEALDFIGEYFATR